MATTSQTQIVQEAPRIEDARMRLLDEAESLAFGLPNRETANRYLQQNPDVAAEFARNPGGMTPEQFVQQHYQTFGAREGRAAPTRPTLGAQLQQFGAYNVAGFTPAQQAALDAAAMQGIGAYNPYMENANRALGAAYATTGEAADVLRGADTRNQFFDAQAAMRQAAQAAANTTAGIGQIGEGLSYLDSAARRAAMSDTTGQFGAARQDLAAGLGALATGQNLAAGSSQANLRPATSAIYQGIGGLGQAQQLALGASGANFLPSQGLLLGASGGYNPASAQAFMDPYRQQVIDETMRQMDRQAAIANQGLANQAVRSGAFGGEREGVQRAEMQRNLMDQKAATIANLLSQGYSQAQAQAMSAFEQQQGRQMQAGQQFGSQAAQQAQLGQGAAGLYGNLAQNEIAAGQGLGQLGVQQAQLGQGAAGQFLQAGQQYGNLASQGGALAGQESAINQNISNLLMQQAQARNQAAQTAAGIFGQQGQQFQQLGQGIGALAGQQFGIGQQQAQGLGAMAGQLGQLGVQQAALGQTAQGLQQGDINFLFNTGQARQALNQQVLDAQRATNLQQIYAPYQQAGFLSDIQRGAPSSQMQTSISSTPQASPFQQAVGIGLGALSTAAGAKRAGLF